MTLKTKRVLTEISKYEVYKLHGTYLKEEFPCIYRKFLLRQVRQNTFSHSVENVKSKGGEGLSRRIASHFWSVVAGNQSETNFANRGHVFWLQRSRRALPPDIVKLSVKYMYGNSWEICHRCAKILLARGWTQNAISILFAKYRLVSEVLRIWFLRQTSYNFVHNFLLTSVKDWYSCQLLIFSSDDIVCWSKFSNFDMWVGCQKLSAMLNLRLIAYWKI